MAYSNTYIHAPKSKSGPISVQAVPGTRAEVSSGLSWDKARQLLQLPPGNWDQPTTDSKCWQSQSLSRNHTVFLRLFPRP